MEKIYHYFRGNDDFSILDIEQQKQKASTFIKQSFSSKNLSIFIGSGCSVPAIPLMSQTMSEILEDDDILTVVKQYLGAKPTSYFKNYLSDRKNWSGIEDTEKDEITSLEDYIGANNFSSISDLDNKAYISNEIVKKYLNFLYESYSDIESLLNWIQNGLNYDPNNKKLSDAFKTIKSKFIATILNLQPDDYTGDVFKTYSMFYKHIFKVRGIEESKVSIFTTNYDLFNEKGLEANNILYTTGFTSTLQKRFDINQFKYRLVDDTNRYKDKWQPTFKEANLYKIHGSINWSSSDEGELYQVEGEQEHESVVIYPTMLKHRETAQAPYSKLFREFSNSLQKPNTTLIVIGYGFPDEHINTIISQNLKNQDFKLIVFGDINEMKMRDFYNENKNSGFHLIGGEIENGKRAHHFNVIIDELLDYVPASKSEEVKSDE